MTLSWEFQEALIKNVYESDCKTKQLFMSILREELSDLTYPEDDFILAISFFNDIAIDKETSCDTIVRERLVDALIKTVYKEIIKH